MTPEPIVQKSHLISIVWTLPIIALCICGWLLYSSYRDKGVEITVYFNDASGIVPGKTQVMVRGIPVGLVKKIHPDLQKQRIKTIIEMEQEVTDNLVEDTLFWVVRPELSASSVQGLDTILSGSYIGLRPGLSTKSQREFEGLSSTPPVSLDEPGLHLRLRAKTLGSIQVGTSIYFRNIEIGSVQRQQLDGDAAVLIDIFIRPQFANLVREGSRFCNVSGLSISGKLPNVRIHMESLASLLRGGILLFTPEPLMTTPLAQNSQLYELYPDYNAADYGIPMTLTLNSSEGIVEGATKVMYRGLEAGFVKEITFSKENHGTVTAHILLDPRAELILREGTQFWLVKPELSSAGAKNLQLLLSGAYITFLPGEGAVKNHFDILPEPPPIPPFRPGQCFVLTTHGEANVTIGSPVFFKNVQVGEVTGVEISTDGSAIQIPVFIYKKYLNLVSRRSVFWQDSGVRFSADLNNGIDMSTGPLSKILTGRIVFTTPDKKSRNKKDLAPEKFDFTLYDSYQEAEKILPAEVASGQHIRVIAADPPSLNVGAPLLYKNIEIGKVEKLALSPDMQNGYIDILIYPEYGKIITPATRFYNLGGVTAAASLNGVEVSAPSLQSIVAGGLGCINLDRSSSTGPTPPKSYPLYDNLRQAQRGETKSLTIFLKDSDGLKEGAPLQYRGVTIGQIETLQLDSDLHTVKAAVGVPVDLLPLFRTATRIWVEKAEIRLSGIENPQSMIFGSYLNMLPGAGTKSTAFIARSEPPRVELGEQTGLHLVLETTHLGSLSIGSPVYFRQLQIGEVTDFDLAKSFDHINVHLAIDRQYAKVIRDSSKFWNISGMTIEGGIFSGVKLETGSLTSVIKGGIATATPDNGGQSSPVHQGERFVLYDKPDKEWLNWKNDQMVIKREEPQDQLKKPQK